ncbi:MAG: uracil-DNA glycosylase [Geobacteraceae bacterium]|nr:uracil-DNA glycosylase [Geobacteraceae bacterium]
MTGNDEVRGLLGSLRVYLEELRESGVDGLPYGTPETVSTPAGEKQRESLDDIRTNLGECGRCQLGKTRTNLVFGVGNPEARLVFVGEAPGRDEDLQGEPFVGEAGQLLTKIIQAMGFRREEVYICNVLKCRPPNNRNPQPSEVEQCHPFMLRQVKAIGPAVVVALGTFAAQTLLQTKEPISRLRGRFHDYHGIPLMPTFHPAFLLRNAEKKREVWEDMQQVMRLLGKDALQKKDG